MSSDANDSQSDLGLARLHADALFTHDHRSRIRTDQPCGRPAPRCFLSRTQKGLVVRCRADLEDALVRELHAAAASEPLGEEHLLSPPGAPLVEQALERLGPIAWRRAGPAYAFPRDLPKPDGAVLITPANACLLDPLLTEWHGDVLGRPFLYASVVDSRAVSACTSSRTTPEADEAGVETAASFRGCGHARRAVLAWAQAVQNHGRIPLYSTSWDNVASQAFARSLGLRRYAADLALG